MVVVHYPLLFCRLVDANEIVKWDEIFVDPLPNPRSDQLQLVADLTLRCEAERISKLHAEKAMKEATAMYLAQAKYQDTVECELSLETQRLREMYASNVPTTASPTQRQ